MGIWDTAISIAKRIQYTQQWFNRRRKALVPENNQKKQNFGACFRENLIEVQSYPKESQKHDKIAGLN